MEYLMTYGWVILVVMIVSIVLWQFGVFESNKSGVTAIGFSKFKPQLAATGLSIDGVFSAVFTNTVGTTVNVKGVKITDVDTGSVVCCSHTQGMPEDCQSGSVNNAASNIGGRDHAYLNIIGNTVAIRAGKNTNVEMGRTAASMPPGPASNDCVVPSANPGETYNIELQIFYDMDLGGVVGSHKETGSIRGPFE